MSVLLTPRTSSPAAADTWELPGFLDCGLSECSHLRVDFQDKVFLLFELRDGLQHVAHGQDSTAVRSAVLDVRRTLLAVVQQHAACKQEVGKMGHGRGSLRTDLEHYEHLLDSSRPLKASCGIWIQDHLSPAG